MTQALVHRAIPPRINLLAAAVLSSLATAEAAPPKTGLTKKLYADDAPPNKDLAIADKKVAYDDSAKTTEHQQIGKKQRGPRYGVGKKVDVTAVLSHEFGGLPVAHHREPLATAGMARRREHLSVH